MSKQLLDALESLIDEATQSILGMPYSKMDSTDRDRLGNYILKDLCDLFTPDIIIPTIRDNECEPLEDIVVKVAEEDVNLLIKYLDIVIYNYQAEIINSTVEDPIIKYRYKISLTHKACYDPFTVSPAIINIARDLTSEQKSEEDNAKAIYDYIEVFNYGRNSKSRIPREPPQTLEDKTGNCNEQTRLFIVMGRVVGLDTGYAYVWQDCYGKAVEHACAWVKLNDEIKYVDSAYHQWDIKHKGVKPLSDDDVRTTYSRIFKWRKKKLEEK